MRLASVEVIPYALPFTEPYVTARGALTQRELVLLRLTTEDGLVGLGEAVPLSLRGGASLAQVVRELEELGRSGELDRRVAQGVTGKTSRLEDPPTLSAPARCAALTALIDLGEKLDDLGRVHRSETEPSLAIAWAKPDQGAIRCNATLIAGEPAAVAEDALRWAEEGFASFKLKLGAGEDVVQVAAVREAVGPEAKIRIDANAAWTLEQARRVLAELEPLGIELAEQPVEMVEDAAELTRTTTIPLAGDESIASLSDAERAVELGAFQITGIKLSKVGGYWAGAQIAELMPAYVSSALDGPVGIAIGARLARLLDHRGSRPSSPPFAHGLATQRLFDSTIASVECELRGGMLHLPRGPGLGVEIDEYALQVHRL